MALTINDSPTFLEMTQQVLSCR
uniref:Uncharacterized protein n=1 Tax=Timema poppense TaxID=170557 RepID=A0A7R9CZ42_TIMPO|nr:unnamed protein product [Timema poppensis]